MIASVILSAALATGVPPWMLDAVAWVESRHNPAAVHHNRNLETGEVMSTDRGLFQINDKAHPYAPAWDIKGATFYAARYLRWLKSVTGTWRDALIAYNVGIGKWMRGIRPARYARLVLAMDEVYK